MFDSDVLRIEEPDWDLDVWDPEEWEPIPAEVLAEVGVLEPAGTPEDPYSVPAGLDDWVLQSQLVPVDDHTLAWLNATPVELLSEQGRSIKLRQLEVIARYIDAQRAELVAVIAGPKPAGPRERLDDFAAQEVAVASLCSVYAADRQVWTARDLQDRLVRTAAKLRLGEISLAQAIALSEATGQLDIEIARQIEDRMLKFSHRQDITRFKSSLRRWVAKLDPDFTRKATETRKQVEVSHTAFDDGAGPCTCGGWCRSSLRIGPDTRLLRHMTPSSENPGRLVDTVPVPETRSSKRQRPSIRQPFETGGLVMSPEPREGHDPVLPSRSRT